MQSLPHIVYLSRGLLFEYSGGRDKLSIKQFAYNTRDRHLIAAQKAADSGQQQQQHSSDDGGRPVPGPPGAFDRWRDGSLQWAEQLHRTLTELPSVAVALVAVGVLLGALLTVLAFALLLPNDAAHKSAAAARSAKLAAHADGTGKARKAE